MPLTMAESRPVVDASINTGCPKSPLMEPHALFLLPEMVSAIFKELAQDKQTLARLGSSCRFFSVIALDILWRVLVSCQPLFVLQQHAAEEVRHGRDMGFCRSYQLPPRGLATLPGTASTPMLDASKFLAQKASGTHPICTFSSNAPGPPHCRSHFPNCAPSH